MKKLWMLRYWLVTLLGAVSLICLVAYHQHEISEQYRGHRATYCAAFSKTTVEEAACIEERESAKDYQKWWFVLVSWPEGISTWAIIATGAFIAWQSWETRESAKATASSVMLANKVFQVQRNKEKPKVSVFVTGEDIKSQTPNVAFQISFKCPSVAWVKNIQGKAMINEKGVFPDAETKAVSPLGFKLMTLEEDHVEDMKVIIEGKGGSFRMSESTRGQIQSGEMVIVLIVRVIFSDIYGDRDFMFSSVGEASQLLDLGGVYKMYWKRGPEHLNWDKQAD